MSSDASKSKQITFVVIYMALWIAYYLLVHSTARDKVDIHPAVLVVLVEAIKLVVATCLYLVQVGTVLDLVKIVASAEIIKLLMSYVPIAVLYAAYNILSVHNLRYFDPTTFLLLSSTRLLLTVVVWQKVFDELISWDKWKALILMAIGVMIKAVPAMMDEKFQLTSQQQQADATDIATVPSISNYTWHVFLLLTQLICAVAASVYNEKILKGNASSIHPHVHNMCLYIAGVIIHLSVLAYYVLRTSSHDGGAIEEIMGMLIKLMNSYATQASILTLAAAGVSTSLLLRYIDSVAKSVVGSTETAITAVVGFFVFGYKIHPFSALSIATVSMGAHLYAKASKEESDAEISFQTDAKTPAKDTSALQQDHKCWSTISPLYRAKVILLIVSVLLITWASGGGLLNSGGFSHEVTSVVRRSKDDRPDESHLRGRQTPRSKKGTK